MYVVTLDQNDLTWLAFAAGIAAGSGNQAAHASLFGILARVQDLPDGHEVAFTAEVEESPEYVDVAAEDFGGTLDPQFQPPMSQMPTRPADEFGAGHSQGGVSGTPIA